jgi:Mor family transcriptional regulator
MQAIWNKDSNRLQFSCLEILEHANKEDLIHAEQQHLDKANVGNNEYCMNILRVANSHLGIKRSPETIEKLRKIHIGRKASEETRAKQRAAKLGKKQSLETIIKRTGLQKGRSCNRPKGVLMLTLRKLSAEQVKELRDLKASGMSYLQLQSKYSLALSTIQRIISRKSYMDVL